MSNSESNRVLFLRSSYTTEDERVEKIKSYNKNIDFQISNFSKIFFKIDGDISIEIDKQPIESFKYIYFRSWRKDSKDASIAIAIAKYLEKKTNILFDDPEVSFANTGNKLTQMVILNLNNLPIPKTLFFSSSEFALDNIKRITKELSFPMIVKSVRGARGNSNFRVKNKQELITILSENPTILFLIQEYIHNQYDFRILTLGYKAKVAEKRIRKNDESHLNNASQGAVEEFVNINQVSADILLLAEEASIAFSRKIAGVDIIESSEDEKKYIIEVNPSPGFSIDDPTSNELEEFYKYIASNIENVKE